MRWTICGITSAGCGTDSRFAAGACGRGEQMLLSNPEFLSLLKLIVSSESCHTATAMYESNGEFRKRINSLSRTVPQSPRGVCECLEWAADVSSMMRTGT